MKVESKVVIERPVDEVWQFFDNPDNMGRWLRGFKRFEPLSGEPGQPGAKARHVYEERGRKLEMVEEVTAREEHERFEGRLTHKTMESDLTTTFRDLGEGRTELICSVDTHFRSFPLRLFGPLMKGTFQRRQDGDFQRLKQVIEGEG